MRIVFAGTPEPAVPSLQALLDSRHEVLAVVTRPDAPAGRGRSLRPSPVKELAVEAGIEVLTPVTARDPEFHAALRALEPDAVPVVAYGNLVPAEALTIPRHGWINLHFSLLPHLRGAAPVQHAIIDGESRTGASTFVLEAGLDTGPVIDTITTEIGPDETSGDLLGRLAVEGAALLVRTLDALEDGSATLTVQAGEVTLAPKLVREHGLIDWSRPAGAIHDLVRGCSPAPGAWTTFRGQTLKVHATATPDDVAAAPAAGQLVAERNRVLVGTGDGVLRLVTVQPQGKKAMAAADWARGVRVGDDDVLGA